MRLKAKFPLGRLAATPGALEAMKARAARRLTSSSHGTPSAVGARSMKRTSG